MRRRDFVKGVVLTAAAPKLLPGQTQNPAPAAPAPVPWTTGLNPATPVPKPEVAEVVAETELRFFTPAQMATLRRLSDVFLPALGNRPGALAAGVPAFLDFFIGSFPEDRQQMYRNGLDWLDAEARKKYSQPFAGLDDEQANVLLKPWMRTWMSDHPPREEHADFINLAHADIRSATINSKAWSEAPESRALGRTAVGLYWYPIEPDLYAGRGEKTRTTKPAAKKGLRTSPPSNEVQRRY